jgi:hypothetical protein
MIERTKNAVRMAAQVVGDFFVVEAVCPGDSPSAKTWKVRTVTLYRSLPGQTELDRRTTKNTMRKLFALAGLQNPAGSGSEPSRTRAGGDGDRG